MSGANEFVEQMEHAAHGDHKDHGHGGGGKDASLGKYVGITMACLGVLLALCSALVGASRTELISTMVKQTNTAMKYQTISTKYRMLVSQLTQLHALCPDPKLFSGWDDESKKIADGMTSPEMGKLARMIRLENAKNLNAEIPTREDLVRFATNIKGLDKEMEAAQEWTESYEDAIEAHAEAAEHFEWSQLLSEIGIVVASIALLFLARPVWYLALLLGLAAVIIATTTHMTTRDRLHKAEEKIHHAQTTYESHGGEAAAKKADEELLHSVEHDETPAIKP